MSNPTLWISVGANRESKSWVNQQMTWEALAKRLSETHRTNETVKEYQELPKEQAAEKKDVGGFVGGTIRTGRRLARNITSRSLITLDIDYYTGTADSLFEGFRLLFSCSCVLYSTHSHRPDRPRLRLIIPLDKEIPPDQYEAVARRVAGDMGIELFDPKSFECQQLMYWPSTPKDGEFVYRVHTAEALSVAEQLARYKDWRDVSQWPRTAKDEARHRAENTKMGDPLAKPGIVGAFCRVYDIRAAIDKFLPDVYVGTDDPNRYTYKQGSTTKGLVIYDDLYAYSNHGTDPATGREWNAFDLVRIHKFGHLDENVEPSTPFNKRPSATAMMEFSVKLPDVKAEFALAVNAAASDIFSGMSDDEKERTREWLKQCDIDKRGIMAATADNVRLILFNDPGLAGCVAYDEFSDRKCVLKPLPWRYAKLGDFWTDQDRASLLCYIEKRYKIGVMAKIDAGLESYVQANVVNPVRKYLQELVWDQNPRLETLLIDYFGANDNSYVRSVTRKTFVAACKRIYEPGCKFDNVLILISPEGKNKSSFLEKMARSWFSADLGSLSNETKAMEQLRGVWIMEVGELVGFRKSDTETIKNFLSKTSDNYRKAFGHETEFRPRRCIFIGTSNKTDFIVDPGENRRFWPVQLSLTEPIKDVWEDLTETEIGQIWAEAVSLMLAGEPVHLNENEREEANNARQGHRDLDERTEAVRRYLDFMFPNNWEDMTEDERTHYASDPALQALLGEVPRDRVTVLEIWQNVFFGKVLDATHRNTYFIRNIIELTGEWEKRKIKMGGRVVWGFVRKGVFVTKDGKLI